MTKSQEFDGGIRVGQPKIWRYERIYPLLDGMLRDIESTSLQAMSPMNPNEANLQYIDFLRSLIDVQLSYNQAITVNKGQASPNNGANPANKGQASDSPTDPATNSKPAPTGSTAGSGDTFLAQVPEDIKKALLSKMGSADLPASKQLDNYLTLLNERLSKQLSVIEDDASRNGFDLYLMQFDVGLYAFKNKKNNIARIRFSFGPGNCTSDVSAYAYSLIPGSSAYNIQEYIGRSQHTGLVGAFNLIMGFGANASYQKQRDQLNNGLVQSVYESGFTDGTCSFGWYYGPSPFENFVSPGIRSTYALVAVRKDLRENSLTMKVETGWETEKGVVHQASPDSLYRIPLPKLLSYEASDPPGEVTPPIRPNQRLSIRRLAYQTSIKPDKVSTGSNPLPVTNTVLIVLDQPADPDLLVTVAGTLLKRTRDTRGEAIRDGTATPPRGAFEVDGFGANSWILANPTTLLLQISPIGADEFTEEFPEIRLTDSSSPGQEVLSLLDPAAELDINGFRITGPIPSRGAFAPLFSARPKAIDDDLNVSVDERPDRTASLSSPAQNRRMKIRIGYHPSDSDYLKLNDTAQVVLDATTSALEPRQWALKCTAKNSDLICDVPNAACDLSSPSCDVFPSDSRVSIRTTLYQTSTNATVTKAPISARGSAVFDSGEVLPYIDLQPRAYSVDFRDRRWIITIQGTHTNLVKPPDFISEFNGCSTSDRIRSSLNQPILTSPSDLQLSISILPADFDQVCSSNNIAPFRLRHFVASNKSSERLNYFSELNSSGPSVVIALPNFRNIIQGRFYNLKIVPNGDDSYSVSGPLLVANAVDRVSFDQQKSVQARAVASNTISFQVPPEIKKARRAFVLSFSIIGSEALHYATDESNNNLCMNFNKGNSTGCVNGLSQDAVPASSKTAPTQTPANDSATKPGAVHATTKPATTPETNSAGPQTTEPVKPATPPATNSTATAPTKPATPATKPASPATGKPKPKEKRTPAASPATKPTSPR